MISQSITNVLYILELIWRWSTSDARLRIHLRRHLSFQAHIYSTVWTTAHVCKSKPDEAGNIRQNRNSFFSPSSPQSFHSISLFLSSSFFLFLLLSSEFWRIDAHGGRSRQDPLQSGNNKMREGCASYNWLSPASTMRTLKKRHYPSFFIMPAGFL